MIQLLQTQINYITSFLFSVESEQLYLKVYHNEIIFLGIAKCFSVGSLPAENFQASLIIQQIQPR